MDLQMFGETVLNHRDVRSIESERQALRKHIAPSKLTLAATSWDVHLFVRDLCQKKASDFRGERKLSRASVKRILQTTSVIFAAAVEQGLRHDNPCTGVKVKQAATDTEDKWTHLSKEEILAIDAAHIPPAAKALVLFAACTGLRQGEQWNLEMRDVDLSARVVTVRFGSKGRIPKNGRKRTVPLFGLAWRHLNAWLAIRGTGPGLVFPSTEGCRRQPGAPVAFDRWLQAAGITRHVRWHDLRHTAASALIGGYFGPPWGLVDIRDFLGHSSVKVTEQYTHIGQTGMKRAAAQMEE